MIESLYLDGVQLHDTANLTLVEFAVGSPSPRDTRAARPHAHGAVDRTRFYDGRVFELRGEVWAGDADTFWQAVDALKGALALGADLKPLVFTREGLGFSERAEVRVASEVTMPLKAAAYYTEWGVSLFAPDPRIYSDSLSTATFDPTTAASGEGVEFPLEFPLVFVGASSANVAVSNGGNFESPPVFTVAGPATNPIIENDTTGDGIYTTGLEMVAGDELVIDVNERTVLLNGVSRPDYIDASTTSWPVLIPGENLVRLRGSGFGTGSLLTIEYRDARI